jgi:hypothetical protein
MLLPLLKPLMLVHNVIVDAGVCSATIFEATSSFNEDSDVREEVNSSFSYGISSLIETNEQNTIAVIKKIFCFCLLRSVLAQHLSVAQGPIPFIVMDLLIFCRSLAAILTGDITCVYFASSGVVVR